VRAVPDGKRPHDRAGGSVEDGQIVRVAIGDPHGRSYRALTLNGGHRDRAADGRAIRRARLRERADCRSRSESRQQRSGDMTTRAHDCHLQPDAGVLGGQRLIRQEPLKRESENACWTASRLTRRVVWSSTRRAASRSPPGLWRGPVSRVAERLRSGHRTPARQLAGRPLLLSERGFTPVHGRLRPA
jgi:hypothetical protein